MDILRAIVFGALPVALFTFVCFQWLVASGRVEHFSGRGELEEQLKTQARSAKEARKRNGAGGAQRRFDERTAGDFFHNKLMSFGGGFYGTMALMTYVVIEGVEIWQFLVSMTDPMTWIDRLGLQLLIQFLVNSIMNLVAAAIWFITLPKMISMDNGLIWLGAAYGGYLAGLHVTSQWGNRIWAWAAGIIKSRRLW